MVTRAERRERHARRNYSEQLYGATASRKKKKSITSATGHVAQFSALMLGEEPCE